MGNKLFSKQFLEASTIGLSLVFSTVIGLGIGYWLDGKFHTRPWFTVIFLILGIIAGFREVMRIAKKQDNGTGK